jgi:hypothetical protein
MTKNILKDRRIAATATAIVMLGSIVSVTGLVTLPLNAFADPQFARPSEDVSNAGGWQDDDTLDDPDVLYNDIDEVVSDGDTTYVKSNNNPSTSATFEVKLNSVDDPCIDTGHVIKAKARPNNGNRPVYLQVQLYQGSTFIAETSSTLLAATTPPTYTDVTYTLLETEADDITTAGYSDLRLRFVPSTGGSSGNTKIFVTWAVLEVPEPDCATVTVDFDPDTLNVNSQGGSNSVTVYVTDYTFSSYAGLGISYNGYSGYVEATSVQSVDLDDDGVDDSLLKFDRQEVIAVIEGFGMDYPATVTIEVYDGATYIGTDTVNVINPT